MRWDAGRGRRQKGLFLVKRLSGAPHATHAKQIASGSRAGGEFLRCHDPTTAAVSRGRAHWVELLESGLLCRAL
jgi:hypothetical protein